MLVKFQLERAVLFQLLEHVREALKANDALLKIGIRGLNIRF